MATSTLGNGTLVLAGTTSGTTTVTATAVAGTTTLTLPAATDTLVGKATTDTLTNKTLTTPSVSSPTISDGTANGVPYLNGSKVLTTGSALVFDGTNLGVGVSPASDGAIHVHRAGASFPTIKITNGTTGTANLDGFDLICGSGGEAYVYNREAQPLLFGTSNTERARFNSTGALVFAGGTTSANGIGITFPATQSASTDANTLDDYEEGTFTPTCTLTTPGTSSSGSAVGVYTKVGNLVTVTGRLTFTKGTGSGDLSFGGLPFTSTSTATYQNSGALSLDTFGVTGKVYYFFLTNSSTAPVLVSSTQAGGAVALAGATDFGASGAGIRYMFSYQTA